MTPLASTLVAVLAATAVRSAWVQPIAAPSPAHGVFDSVPQNVKLWSSGARAITIAPTGADGPSFPLGFDALSLSSRVDRLKQDRMLALRTMGAGFVVTVGPF